jgi:hypothetical protein
MITPPSAEKEHAVAPPRQENHCFIEFFFYEFQIMLFKEMC